MFGTSVGNISHVSEEISFSSFLDILPHFRKKYQKLEDALQLTRIGSPGMNTGVASGGERRVNDSLGHQATLALVGLVRRAGTIPSITTGVI